MKETLFEEYIPPHGPVRYKMNYQWIPVGYKVDHGGVQVRHNTRTYQGWKDVTSVPCVLSALGEQAADGSCRMVEITFQNTLDVTAQIWIETRTAFDSKIAKILRENGAACTARDGVRLAEYLRECYDLRREEACSTKRKI